MKTYGTMFLLVALGVLTIAAEGAEPAKPATPEKPAASSEHLITFTFDNKPWSQVIEWFADATGLAFVGPYKPAGTFTFIPPKINGQLKKYTIPEVVDLLNEALQVNSSTKRYILIRRSQTFTLVPADEKIPRDMIPTVEVADLPKHGQTEVVRINVLLDGDAEELAPKIKKVMTQLGDAIPVDSGSHVVLVDTVASLREVMKTIKTTMNETQKDSPEYFAYQCRFIKAHEAERLLRELFNLSPMLTNEMRMWRMQVLAQQPQLAQLQPKGRQLTVASSEETNVVIVSGPAHKVAEAKKTIMELEEKAKASGAKETPIGASMVKRYQIPGGGAEWMANMLQEKYRPISSVRIVPLGPTEIMVWGPVAEQFEIAAIVTEGMGNQKIKMVPVKQASAYFMEDTLKGMFGDRKTNPRAPYIESTNSSNITLQGTPEQIAEIEAAIKLMDVPSYSSSLSSSSGNFKLISLDRGSGTAVAEEVQKILKEMGKDAKIIRPGEKTEPKKPEKSDPSSEKGDQKKSDTSKQTTQTVDIKEGDAPPLFDPREPKKEKQPGILLIPGGGQITVGSEDPDDRKLVQQLIDLITEKTGNEEFELIKLKHTSAVEVAKMIDEMYNGPKQPQQPQQPPPPPQPQPEQQPQQPPGFPPGGGAPGGGGFGGGRGGRGGFGGSTGGSSHSHSSTGSSSPSSSSRYSSEHIRVIADPNLNAILLRAAMIDSITIKKLIEKIDVIDKDSQQIVKNHSLKLEKANAIDVANTIRELYRQVMDVTPLPGQRGSGQFNFAVALGGNPNAGRPVDVNGQPRAASLTIGVDEHSNTLLIQATDLLWEDVKKLAEDLDKGWQDAAKSPHRKVAIRPLRGLDPALVQQAVDAIQGDRRTSMNGGGGNPFGGGGFGGPMGGGGFGRPFPGFGGQGGMRRLP